MHILLSGALSILVIIVVNRVLKHRADKLQIGFLPRLTVAFGTLHPVGILGPTTWWNPSVNFPFYWRNKIYETVGADVFAILPLVAGPANVYTRSIEALQQISLPLHQQVVKPAGVKLVLNLWGPNVVGTDGEDWKRHRRIIGPAFSSRTYDTVWSETARLYKEMVEQEGWDRDGPIQIPVANRLMYKLALSVIAAAGFGLKFPWKEDLAEDEMSLQNAIRIFAGTTQHRLLLPRWIYKLPVKWIRDIETAYRVVGEFMDATIERGRIEARERATFDDENQETGNNVFSRLIAASEQAGAGLGLSNEELRGSVFIMIFAGHETTAIALTTTLAFLALYPEEQEVAYRHIMDKMPSGSGSSSDFSHLEKLRACIVETVRLLPAGSILTREVNEDMVLRIPNTTSKVDGDRAKEYHFKKGTQLVVDFVGINYNPAYFPDPEEYRPSRWYSKEKDSDTVKDFTTEAGFTSFGIGPRVCVGKKFAMTEVTCFLAHILRDYEVSLGDLRPGETREQWRLRYMQFNLKFTLQPGDLPLVLTRRRGG